MRLALAFTTIAAFSTPALAGPGFVTLDRLDASSFAGGELSYFLLDGDDATALRFDLHGQYVDPVSGFGGYLAVPIAHLAIDNPLFPIDATAVGNIDLGAIFVPRMRSQDFGMIVRAGITAPTAPDDEDGLALLGTATARLTDYYLAVPEGVVLRVGVSPIFRSGQVFGRIDAGADIVMSAAGSDPDPLLRLNLGVGIDLGNAAITGEIANVFYTGDSTSDDDALTTLALGFRGHTGSVAPYGAIGFPLDDEFDGIDAILTFGLDVLLR